MQRRTVTYRGQVQGVGFRATTQHIATRFPVTGYVQNLPDGSVRLVAEGESEPVDRFVEEIAETLSAYIHSTDVVLGPPEGRWPEFSIRY